MVNALLYYILRYLSSGGGRLKVSKPLAWHRFYRGKIEVFPKCAIRDLDDFAVYYTPGVAEPCLKIKDDEDLAFEYTSKWNTVAVVTDGSRVLGLGNIGALASLPVMEGKALIFKYLGGVDAFPLPINEQDPDRFIEIVKKISPAFGGINLEDIATPKCFYILEKLRNELDIPVWHDDQQGTATATLAGLINALKLVGKRIDEIKIAVIGVGASNTATVRLLEKYGAKLENMFLVDSKGILGRHREDLKGTYKWEFCLKTNGEGRVGGIREALKGVDVVIAASRPGPDVIKPEWIKEMADDPIVFALANPVPEIMPEDAKRAGAKIVATGRSDFPNQVNNSLVFPAMFRGVLTVRAKTITDEMAIKAAEALAKFAEPNLSEDYIIPRMTDEDVFPHVATEVALKAIEQGIARKVMSRDEIYRECEELIRGTQEKLKKLMELGFIPQPP